MLRRPQLFRYPVEQPGDVFPEPVNEHPSRYIKDRAAAFGPLAQSPTQFLDPAVRRREIGTELVVGD
jgi:hypothetical protein